MLKKLYTQADALYCAENFRRDTEKLNALEKSVCHSDFDASTAFVAETMRRAGLEQVERITLKADGVSSAFDAVMPQAWDLTGRSRLMVTGGDWPEGVSRVLADTDETALAVSTWSGGTPEEGLTGEVVVYDPRNLAGVKGKWVFYDGMPTRVNFDIYEAGALGIVATDFAQGEGDPDATRWMNGVGRWGWYYLKDEAHVPCFAITARRGKLLLEQLKKGRRITLTGVIHARSYDGSIYTVTGVVPGGSDREFALFAHLYEPFLFDDACGFGACVEIARIIKAMRLGSAKTLRLVFSMEHYGFAQYLAGRLADRKLLAALNMDGLVGLAYRELGEPLHLRKSPAANPFFGELLMQTLLADHAPALRWEGGWGRLSDDTFGGDPMIDVPTNWIYSQPGIYHHTSGRLFADMDWERSGELLRVQSAYTAFMLGARAEDFRNLLERFKAFAVQEFDAADTPWERKVKCDFAAGQIASCNRMAPGCVAPEEIAAWIDPYRLPGAELSIANATEADAARIVPVRSQPGTPWSLARIPAAEKRKFAYSPHPAHIAMFDGRRSVLEAVKTIAVFQKRAMPEAELAAMLAYLAYLEQYGYWQLLRK